MSLWEVCIQNCCVGLLLLGTHAWFRDRSKNASVPKPKVWLLLFGLATLSITCISSAELRRLFEVMFTSCAERGQAKKAKHSDPGFWNQCRRASPETKHEAQEGEGQRWSAACKLLETSKYNVSINYDMACTGCVKPSRMWARAQSHLHRVWTTSQRECIRCRSDQSATRPCFFRWRSRILRKKEPTEEEQISVLKTLDWRRREPCHCFQRFCFQCLIIAFAIYWN